MTKRKRFPGTQREPLHFFFRGIKRPNVPSVSQRMTLTSTKCPKRKPQRIQFSMQLLVSTRFLVELLVSTRFFKANFEALNFDIELKIWTGGGSIEDWNAKEFKKFYTPICCSRWQWHFPEKYLNCQLAVTHMKKLTNEFRDKSYQCYVIK